MNFFRQFAHRPQRLWLRRLNFQVHLWVGIVLALYFIVIGITGSILVFREELETLAGLKPWHHLRVQQPVADIVTVIENVRAAYPRARVLSVLAPTQADPTFMAVVQRRGEMKVAADPATGAVLGTLPRNSSWVGVIQRLHVNLLLGLVGRKLNGVAAAFLLLLNLTGLVIWWPGIKLWTRALKVDFRRRWRRVNWDLHNAVGFWTLAIVTLWAVSGVYFAWPSQTFSLVNRLSPIVTARPPAVFVPAGDAEAWPDLHAMISAAYSADPGTSLKGIAFPFNRRAPLLIFMNRGNNVGYEYADTLYFDPYDGRLLKIWRYGVNQSLGDWFIWLQIPLHFGTYWGLWVKILWAALGLAIPLLTVTGALMYWNRALRRKWVHWRAPAPQTQEVAAHDVAVR
jgi:uncharacterized iron-regulated membrane protein